MGSEDRRAVEVTHPQPPFSSHPSKDSSKLLKLEEEEEEGAMMKAPGFQAAPNSKVSSNSQDQPIAGWVECGEAKPVLGLLSLPRTRSL
ncbi:hypothetical protein Taro_036294 [Colocasia esculenta]|uniref:Uncharacterized protein n=1 Tax=Colocasia esculenta TaxID=4460 RepID=A0A843W6C1_COLES|nr:hypothetical protein [Colocasia esculenta]